MDKQKVLDLTKNLSANEEKLRLRAFETVKRLLSSGQLSQEYFGYIWQGLYFCLWHSDTAVKQYKMAEDMTSIPCKEEDFFEWFKFALIVLRKHWNELDFYRINKFMYLIRLILVACFKNIEAGGFKKAVFSSFNERISEVVLNEDVLERGFILHIVQLYPSIAVDINYRNTTELFFAFKPIFNFLAFTQVRVLRENVAEKLILDFVPFCAHRLTREGFEFVKEKLTDYATAEGVAQPNRNKLYEVLQAMEEALEVTDFTHIEEGGKPRLGPKTVASAQLKAKLAAKKEAAKTLSASSSLTSIENRDVSPAMQKIQNSVPLAREAEARSAQDPLSKKKDKAKANANVKELKQAKAAMADLENTTKPQKKQNGVSSHEGSQDQPLKKKPSKEIKMVSSRETFEAMDEDETNGNGVEGMMQEFADDMENDNRFSFIDKDANLDQIYAGLGIDDEEFDDEAVLNPLENLTFEELKKKLPPYFFLTPKKKLKYFKKVTSDYMAKLRRNEDAEEEGGKKLNPRVNFQLNNSKTKIFNKFHKVGASPVVRKQGSKKILKRANKAL